MAPRWAVFWAAFFNFIAFLFFGLHVAETVGSGIVHAAIVDDRVIFGALAGAIVWNVVTWVAGIPSSSSHALIGGLVGAGLAKVGVSSIVWSGLGKTFAAIFMSPALGFVLALLLVLIVSWAFVRVTPMKVDSTFRILQFASASLYSLGHGANDAQKTMGIIAVLLFSHGATGGAFAVPFWVVVSCQTAMALGTLCGGWRIVHTMGSKITRLSPQQGFCAETGGAITLFMATYLGIPFRPRIRSPAPSSVSARPAASRLCAGRGTRHRRRLGRHHADGRPDLGHRLRCVRPLPGRALSVA